MKTKSIVPARATPDEIQQVTTAPPMPWEYAETRQVRAPLVNISSSRTYVNNSTNVTHHAPPASNAGGSLKVVLVLLAVVGLIVVAPGAVAGFVGALATVVVDVLSGGS